MNVHCMCLQVYMIMKLNVHVKQYFLLLPLLQISCQLSYSVSTSKASYKLYSPLQLSHECATTNIQTHIYV